MVGVQLAAFRFYLEFWQDEVKDGAGVVSAKVLQVFSVGIHPGVDLAVPGYLDFKLDRGLSYLWIICEGDDQQHVKFFL